MTLKPGKNIRLFQSPLLELLTFVHPVMPALLWVPIVSYCFSHVVLNGSMPFKTATLFFIAGLFIWTITEYLLHRFVFHFVPKTPFQERIVFLFHGIHHDDPEDQRRLLMPPSAAILIASIFYGLFTLILGSIQVMPFFAGFIVGYLCYDYIHFATHFFTLFDKGWLRTLKQNHMKHHYAKDHKLYGVSSPLWDYVFRTK